MISSSNPSEKDQYILKVSGLKKYFPIQKGIFRKVVGHVRAVDGIDFSVRRGETLGLVGESGSGKTTVGRCIVRLADPTEGSIGYSTPEGVMDLASIEKRAFQQIRSEIQMIFQDPNSSLNPRMRVGDIVGEPLRIHRMGSPDEQLRRVKGMLEKVGLSDAQLNMFPHQFSGGQKQRIGIARAFILNPKVIICDEPVSALDVSVQAQVLNLLADLQREFHITYLFVAHDLSVVEYISDRIMVMYLGKIVEIASSEQIYQDPKHPYTEGLLAAIPKEEGSLSARKLLLSGTIPDPSNPPPGCVFHTRCLYVEDICRTVYPELRPFQGCAERFVACHRADGLKLQGYLSKTS